LPSELENSVVGPVPIEILARVAAQMGEPDRAIAAFAVDSDEKADF